MKRKSLRMVPLLEILLLPWISNAQGTITNQVNTQKNTAMENNKSKVYDLYEKAINGRNLALLQDIIADEFPGPNGIKGPAAFRANLEPLIRAFPDIHYELTSVVADESKVAVSWRWTGTSKAPYLQYPATGKAITNDGMAIFSFRNGRISSSTVQTDRLGFLLNMDAITPDILAGPAAAAEHVYFIDKFFIPAAAIGEFTERMSINRTFLRTLPGFVRDDAFSYKDDAGNLICATIAVWKDHAAIANAKQAVQAEYQKEGFDMPAMLSRLHITIERGVYSAFREHAPAAAEAN